MKIPAMRIHPISVLCIAAALLLAISASLRAEPVKVIFDTDMGGDTDDVVALSILNEFADEGKCDVLACLADDHDVDKATAAAISSINTYYGRPNIPIGTYQGPGISPVKSGYTAVLRDKFPNSAKPDDQMPLALDVFRKALAAAPDHSVVVVSVGFLNNLRDLLQSKPDAVSPLSGMDLVKQKVQKWVCMGGGYPTSGYECNFEGRDGGADAKYVVENWPTPALFSGFEIGLPILTGKCLKTAPDTNPAKRACDVNGHPSWDPTAAYAAVEDPTRFWTLSPEGSVEVNGAGDEWHPTPNRHQSYLIAKTPPAEVGQALDDLLAKLPTKK
jgi:inosine-uridine nucleoside N-ribohydrolase